MGRYYYLRLRRDELPRKHGIILIIFSFSFRVSVAAYFTSGIHVHSYNCGF